jgi:hypothetical protein
MATRSIDDKRYSRRFILMGAAICGFSLWSLYDGFIKYPREQSRALAYEELEREHRENEWDQLAAEKGWSVQIPQKSKDPTAYDTSIKLQYAMAGLTALIGLPMLLMALASRGKWIESSDAGITTSWGESFNFDQILKVDKRKWAKKGIAKVYYQDGDQQRRFVIDDFKFERPTMDRLLYELEQHIDADKIVNGPPEPPPPDPSAEPAGEYEQPSDQPA